MTCFTSVKVGCVTRLSWVENEEDGNGGNDDNVGNICNDGNDDNVGNVGNGGNDGNVGNVGNVGINAHTGNDGNGGNNGKKIKPAVDIRGTSCKQMLHHIHIWQEEEKSS